MAASGKSGEYAIISEIAEKIYERVDKRVEVIVIKFEEHAKGVSGQLALGDKTMALINQSVQEVKKDVAELSTKVESNSAVVNQMKVDAQNFRRKGDTSPLATPALEPKDSKASVFMTETGKIMLQACASALGVAVMCWVLRGGAAPVVNTAPSPAPPAAAVPASTPP